MKKRGEGFQKQRSALPSSFPSAIFLSVPPMSGGESVMEFAQRRTEKELTKTCKRNCSKISPLFIHLALHPPSSSKLFRGKLVLVRCGTISYSPISTRSGDKVVFAGGLRHQRWPFFCPLCIADVATVASGTSGLRAGGVGKSCGRSVLLQAQDALAGDELSRQLFSL